MRPGPRGVTRARLRPPFRGFRPQRASPGALPGAPVQAAEGRLVPIPRRRRAQAPQSGVGRRGACPSSHIARSPHHSDASNRPFAPVRGPRRPRAARLDHVARLGRLTLLSVLSRRRVKRSHLFANFNQPALTASLPPITTGPPPGALDRRGRPLRRPAQPRGGTPRRGHRRANTKAQALNQRRTRGDRRKIRVVRVGQHVRSHLNRHHRHVLPAPPRGLRRRRVPVVGAVRTAGAHRGRRGGHGVLRAVRSQVPVARLPVVDVHEGSEGMEPTDLAAARVAPPPA